MTANAARLDSIHALSAQLDSIAGARYNEQNRSRHTRAASWASCRDVCDAPSCACCCATVTASFTADGDGRGDHTNAEVGHNRVLGQDCVSDRASWPQTQAGWHMHELHFLWSICMLLFAGTSYADMVDWWQAAQSMVSTQETTALPFGCCSILHQTLYQPAPHRESSWLQHCV